MPWVTDDGKPNIANPALAVVIATKNRSEAMGKYALPSLERSSFRDFVCVVWDASDDTATREVAQGRPWNFEIAYFKAPRVGSSSQRNDGVRHVLENYPSVGAIVFMDDDSELSEDALGGVVSSFRESCAAIVNIRMKPLALPSWRGRVAQCLKRFLGMNRHGATPFLYNYGGDDEEAGIDAEWAGGGGMGVDVSLFAGRGIFFPEEFQRFGGYALGEDFAFSFFVFKKGYGRIVNSEQGYFLHYAAGGFRLDVKNMAASKWYNFHLLFDAVYDDVRGPKLWCLKAQFKLFMCAAALKLLIRARSFDICAVLRGIEAARAALKEYRRDKRHLMKTPFHESAK
ncbi:MAG: glycosyltransferase [Synergistaceae bacterium]|jgi:GT2 family glycosyltransferase|nr:glycosyltransferase [Synergistaceae bacterium]